MANIWITQFRGLDSDGSGALLPIADEPALGTQNLTFTTATQSTVFRSGATYVRLVPNATCHVAFGVNPTATASSERLMADSENWRRISSGHRVSVYDGTS